MPTLSTATPGAPNGEPWVKLCMKNDQTQNKQVCLINHEGLEPNSGMVLVSATVRAAEGDDKQQLFIRLPTFQALVIPVGMPIKIDDKQPIPLPYTICFPMNCQAQIELTKDMMDSLRGGKQMIVAAMNFQQKTIAFPVPLTGFGKVLDGPPVDLAKYEESRKQLADVFRKKAEEAAKAQGGAPGAVPGATGSMPPAGAMGAAPAPSAQAAPANATTAQQKKPATPPAP
jgi:invasion protein IalB